MNRTKWLILVLLAVYSIEEALCLLVGSGLYLRFGLDRVRDISHLAGLGTVVGVTCGGVVERLMYQRPGTQDNGLIHSRGIVLYCTPLGLAFGWQTATWCLILPVLLYAILMVRAVRRMVRVPLGDWW